MFPFLHRKHLRREPLGEETEKGIGLTRPESAASLLDTPRRQKLVEHIWQRTSLSRQQFDRLYRAPLERYAALVQQFPASESHHHSHAGGMLDHGLEIVAYALKIRQSHLLPVGATSEDQAAQAEAWTAATAYAALLHDIGKVAVDLHVEHADGTLWHPWHGPLQRPYRFRYREDREYRLHSAATGLLYNKLLDQTICDWLSSFPAVWSALLYTLAGQLEHAGMLGELVTQADQASVAQALGGNPAKALAAPKHALQRKLLEGLRYLLKEELKLNQPQASDGWLTQDALWLVSKTVSDKLRAHLLAHGVDGIPANNTAVFNVLQDHGMLQPAPGGKAIWRAKVTSDAGWSHDFTLLRLAPALIWESGDRPPAFTGSVEVLQGDGTEQPEIAMRIDGTPSPDPGLAGAPVAAEAVAVRSKTTLMPTAIPDAMDDLLGLLDTPDGEGTPSGDVSAPVPSQEGARDAHDLPSVDATPAVASGEHFLNWLKHGIESHKLIINDARALVHTVDDTVYLVSPGLFQRYVQEHPQIEAWARQEKLQDWVWMQRRFEKLKVHRKHLNGLNIWTCQVTGPRKSRQLHGYLLNEPSLLFSELPPNNPYLQLMNCEEKQSDKA